ncbi:MAG TPA: hypothetical protein VL625_11820 [Patescibacteria group bacterium]|nr:hypothetical protein [Patescibacteria group bacterium]
MKWLRFLGYPVSFRGRDWALYKKLARNDNDITSAELLKIELGEAAFREIGADRNEKLNSPVHVLGIYKNPHMKYLHINPLFNTLLSGMTVAFMRSTPRDKYSPHKMSDAVAERDYNTVYLNRALVFSPLGQVMWASTLYGWVANLARTAVAGVRTLAKAAAEHYMLTGFATGMGISSARSMWPRYLGLPVVSMTDAVGHEHIHLLQKKDRDTKASGFNPWAGTFKKKALAAVAAQNPIGAKLDTYASLGFIRYFMGDHEVEARLHTILARQARQTGHLPKTRDELWLALDAAGLPMPDAIRDELRERLQRDFGEAGGLTGLKRIAQRYFSPDVSELRIAQNALRAPGLKEAFWRETMPYLYGHLLEMYGRGTGRADMGIPQSATATPAPA